VRMRSGGHDPILVSGSNKGEIKIWDMHIAACVGTISVSHNLLNLTSCVQDIDFDALRQRLYISCSSGVAGGSSVSVYDCNGWSKQCCWQLAENYGNIQAMVCATDGVVVGTHDGTVHFIPEAEIR